MNEVRRCGGQEDLRLANDAKTARHAPTRYRLAWDLLNS